MPQNVQLKVSLPRDVNKNKQLPFRAGPPGFPVLKVTNSRSFFGKIPKIPVEKLMTYLPPNTFIIAKKWPTLTHFYKLHKI